MADKCKHCEYRGDMEKCEAAECAQHENWYVVEVVKQRDEILKKWDYYQEFTKVHGSNGITDLVVQRDDVIKERDELRAQLARCVKAITGPMIVDLAGQYAFLDSLPQQAKFDAEVLRCAEKQTEFDIDTPEHTGRFIAACQETIRAVRAAKDGE
jgi:hypothetical protein